MTPSLNGVCPRIDSAQRSGLPFAKCRLVPSDLEMVSNCFWLHCHIHCAVSRAIVGEGAHCLKPEGVTSFAVTGFGRWVRRRLEGILHLGFSILRRTAAC